REQGPIVAWTWEAILTRRCFDDLDETRFSAASQKQIAAVAAPKRANAIRNGRCFHGKRRQRVILFNGPARKQGHGPVSIGGHRRPEPLTVGCEGQLPRRRRDCANFVERLRVPKFEYLLIAARQELSIGAKRDRDHRRSMARQRASF